MTEQDKQYFEMFKNWSELWKANKDCQLIIDAVEKGKLTTFEQGIYVNHGKAKITYHKAKLLKILIESEMRAISENA